MFPVSTPGPTGKAPDLLAGRDNSGHFRAVRGGDDKKRGRRVRKGGCSKQPWADISRLASWPDYSETALNRSPQIIASDSRLSI